MFDCGKMNKMIQLLKRLKREGHKVLIFTQMSKMLDIFEKCLSQFYFNYVRMDGGTKVRVLFWVLMFFYSLLCDRCWWNVLIMTKENSVLYLQLEQEDLA